MVTKLSKHSAAPSLRTKKVIVNLPNGIKVSNKLFNDGAADQFSLVPKVEGIGSKFDGLTQSHFIVYLEMVVVGSIVVIRDEQTTLSELTREFAGMGYEENDTDDDNDSNGMGDEFQMGD